MEITIGQLRKILNGNDSEFIKVIEEAFDIHLQPYARSLVINHNRTNTYWTLRYENHPEYGIDIQDDGFELTQVYKVISVHYVAESSLAGREIVEDDEDDYEA